MEKFNYRISIEASSKEVADMLMDFICKDNIGLLEVLNRNHAEEKKETKQPEPQKENEKEKFLKGIRQFEKVIQIVERCIMDETAIDRIARTLGIIVQPETAKQ